MKQICISFSLFFIMIILSFAPIVHADDPIIKYPNLEEAIKFQLGLDSKESINDEQLKSLQTLDASWWGISDLRGIENATNLDSLYLEGNQLQDIKPLENLTDIRYLALTDNEIDNLQPLSDYTNLNMLDVSYNQINNLDALNTVKFTGDDGGLELSHNQISDLSPLSSVTIPTNPRYFYLDVSHNDIQSLEGLESFAGLTELSAENNQIKDINSVANLSKLKFVNLTNNLITNIDSLANKQELTVIKLSNNSIKDLNGLYVDNTQSYDLEFANNQIVDISSLKNLTQGNVDLTNNNVTDITPLKNMQKGKILLKGNPLASSAMDVIYQLKQRGVKIEYDPIDIPEMDGMRLAGSSRFHTAVEISKEGWNTANTVVIARGDSFPDALAGVPLAFKLDAPILLTDKSKMNSVTMDEIERLKAKTVIILGGTGAVSQAVEDTLKNSKLTVKRVAGSDRFETAKKIAEELGGNPDTAVVAYGYNFPDALAAASYAAQHGYPILLTDTNQLPEVTKNFVANIKNTIVVGGESVVSNAVFGKFNHPLRIGGSNRFSTAAKMVSEMRMSPTKTFIGNGYGFADSLTGSVLAAKQNAPLLLVKKDQIPKETSMIFTSYNVADFTVLGGDASILDEVIFDLTQY